MGRRRPYPPSTTLNVFGDHYLIDLSTIRRAAVAFASRMQENCDLNQIAGRAGISRQSLWHLWVGDQVSEKTFFAVLRTLSLEFGMVATQIPHTTSLDGLEEESA